MKTALVLEGGAMRGMFTAGALDVWIDAHIRFDAIIGVSAGALFGINYPSGQRGRALRYNLKYVGDKRYMGLRSLLGRARFFAALPDEWAADAVRAFAREGVTAGESGAAGYGLLRAVMLSDGLLPLRAAAGLDGRSRVLLVNTETATDPVSYEKILGNFTGQCASNGL